MFILNTITRDLEIRGLREDEMKKLEGYYNDKVRSLKIEKQMKETEKFQKAQKKRERKDEKEKKLMETEATIGRQQTTTRSGRVTKSTKRLNE